MAAVEDIQHFFQSCARADNDRVNKVRETVLKMLDTVPQTYLDNAEHGARWQQVKTAWRSAIQIIALQRAISFDTWITSLKAGRRNNYDIELIFTLAGAETGRVNAEFKYGCKKISKLPQFLSLPANRPLFPITYDHYFYMNHLPLYCSLDSGITEPCPPWIEYQKRVADIAPATPFFKQLKEREGVEAVAKASLVGASIRAYLTAFASTIDCAAFQQKVQETQGGKVYLLWTGGSFHTDSITDADMTGIVFSHVERGNTVVLRSSVRTEYHLRLRWRNHKGILNPAWQIAFRLPRGCASPDAVSV